MLADPESGNPAAYLPALASSLNNLGIRLSETGNRREALGPAQEAVDIRRVLADPESGNPAAYLPDLASSLNNLGIRLSETGNRREALGATQEAVDIYRVLADPESGNPAAYLPALATSLNNLGIRLSETGNGGRRWARPRRPSTSTGCWPTPRAATPPPTCPTSRRR